MKNEESCDLKKAKLENSVFLKRKVTDYEMSEKSSNLVYFRYLWNSGRKCGGLLHTDVVSTLKVCVLPPSSFEP